MFKTTCVPLTLSSYVLIQSLNKMKKEEREGGMYRGREEGKKDRRKEGKQHFWKA